MKFSQKKADYNTKIIEIENRTTTDHDHGQYVIIQEFNKLTAEHFTARLNGKFSKQKWYC